MILILMMRCFFNKIYQVVELLQAVGEAVGKLYAGILIAFEEMAEV